jgi:hypothetical protein
MLPTITTLRQSGLPLLHCINPSYIGKEPLNPNVPVGFSAFFQDLLAIQSRTSY